MKVNWLNTLQVTFTIPRYRLGYWYRPVQKLCIDWCYRSIQVFWTGLYQHIRFLDSLNKLGAFIMCVSDSDIQYNTQ